MDRKTAKILTIISLITALALSGMIYSLLKKSRVVPVHPPLAPRVQMIVAQHPLSLGHRLEPSDVKSVPWLGTALPAGYLGHVDSAVGRVLTHDVAESEPILEWNLAPEVVPAGLQGLIERGKRAVSVKVNEVTSVAGFATPGARVDVLLTAATRAPHEPVTKTILQNIPVLAAGQKMEQDSEGQPISMTVATLLVSPREGETLALAGNEGKIQLALRHPLDPEPVQTTGVQFSSLLGGETPRRPARYSKPKSVMPAPAAVRVEILAGTKRTIQRFSSYEPQRQK